MVSRCGLQQATAADAAAREARFRTAKRLSTRHPLASGLFHEVDRRLGVDREPCFVCGVRGDIGCRCRRRPLS